MTETFQLLRCYMSWCAVVLSIELLSSEICPALNMHKLQCIQNTLSGIVTKCNRYTLASSVLKRPQWLPLWFFTVVITLIWF